MMPKRDAARPSAESTGGDAKQNALAAATTATENFAASRAEAAYRRQEDWNAFFQNRWDRRRKLLPSLKLTYPSDNELRSIAQLAKVRDTFAFDDSIKSVILDAHLNDQVFRTLSIPKVREAISAVAKQAKLLRKFLTQLDVGSGSKGSLMQAGLSIEVELYFLSNLTVGRIMQLPEYIVVLDALNTAAERALSKPIYPPRGAGGNPAFDKFIEQLLMTARMHGGSWTNYRSAAGSWEGTLLQALEILDKYLPKPRFFPLGELGRAVQHIRERLNQRIARS
jgi:hypothetical protein